MQRDWSRGLAALMGAMLAAALLLFAFAAPAAADGLGLRRCPRSVRPEPAPFNDDTVEPDPSRCGRLSVPLDRSGAVPGRIDLRVRVLEPRRRAQATVLALAGGPGQAAVPLLDGFARTLSGSLTRRRLVAFDQRGTGGSGRLRCPSLGRARSLRSIGPAVAACARRLGPRRVGYTSAASVQDIEAVRAAVGAERLILYGTSYGTKVALDYAAAYPQRVERLVLDSVLGQEGNDPFQRATFQAVPPALAALCAGGRCPFTPNPGADVAALVQRIAAEGRLRSRWIDDRGRPRAIGIDRAMLLNALLAGDVDPVLRAAFPAAARAAVEGDLAPLARLLGDPDTGGGGGGGDEALFVATTCEDGGVPWPAGTPVDARGRVSRAELAAVPAAELAPFDAATLQGSGIFDLCRTWPESPIAQPTGALPDVPALLLSGVEDLRTPLSDARRVAALLPRARLVAVPQTGHSVLGSDLGSCAERALEAFMADRPVRDCRTPRRRLLPPRPLAPASFDGLRPAAGLPPRIGRTVTAIAATLSDVDQQTILYLFRSFVDGSFERRERIAWGGLRGGFVDMTDEKSVFSDYEYVPGVVLDGREVLRGGGPIQLVVRIRGRSAAAGRVRIDDGLLIGRLGGRAVRVRIRPTARSRYRLTAAAAAAHLPAGAPRLPAPAVPVPDRWLPLSVR